MSKWFVVIFMVLLTGVFSGCQKKAAQEESASVPVEEAVDSSLANMENQEISQSDEMAAVADQNAQAGQAAVQAVAQTASNIAQTVAGSIPGPQEIQTALKNAGFYQGTIDGNIGPKTKQAIKNFQYKNSLAVDGKVGPKTWNKLSSYLNQSATSSQQQAVAETSQEITEIPATR